MELRQLQIFCVAAQTLNFTKAGLKLGYAQSNITGQIRQLEEELQVKLFERLGRGIQLTAEGKKFYDNAYYILKLCQQAKEEFSPEVFRGTLTIGAAETLCVYRLPQILMKYRQKYPLVKIRLQTDSCENFFELIKHNQVDFAMVLTDNIKNFDLMVQTLHQEQLTVVASPSHPLSSRATVTPHDLAKECLIITTPGCGYRPIILSMLHDHGTQPESIMELSSIGAIKQCTMCGLGVAILPKISVADDLKRGLLTELSWQGPAITVDSKIIYHQGKWMTPPMKAFLDMCSE